MTKVSVLIPVYNTDENSLKESIKSILEQTFKDFELIILDDGSNKDIEAVIKSFDDERISFHKNEKNLGVAKTRNKLRDLAKGEYIAYQDADDISLPERLEKQVKFLDKNPDISALSAWVERFPAKRILRNIPSPKYLDFMGGCVFSQGCAMLRLADFKKFNLRYREDLMVSEDYDLWSRAVAYLKFANLQEILLKYRREENSLCAKHNEFAYKIDKEIKQNMLGYLTDDFEMQDYILAAIQKKFSKKANFFENVFSVRNEWVGNKKSKILTLLGMRFYLYKLKEK